jgi:hypothetical protein
MEKENVKWNYQQKVKHQTRGGRILRPPRRIKTDDKQEIS